MRAPVEVAGPEEVRGRELRIDFRPGGTWQIVYRGPDGDEIAFVDEYLKVLGQRAAS